MKSNNNPTILGISGSLRKEANTDKLMQYISSQFEEKDCLFEWIHPKDLVLTLPGIENTSSDPELLREKVLSCDGILFVTPEYHGSLSSTLKMLIDNLGYPSTLEGKNVSLFGVAMGPSADNAIRHLKEILSVVNANVLPIETSIGSIHKFFDGENIVMEKESQNSISQSISELIAACHNQSPS